VQDLSFFEIFAECSIAFAGFGAVHAALRGAGGPRGDFRAFSVVSHGLMSFREEAFQAAFSLPPIRSILTTKSQARLLGPFRGSAMKHLRDAI